MSIMPGIIGLIFVLVTFLTEMIQDSDSKSPGSSEKEVLELDVDSTQLAIRLTTVACFIVVLMLTGLGSNVAVNAVVGEVTPAEHKTLAYSLYMVMWFGVSGFLQMIFPLIYEQVGGNTFFIFAGSNLTAAVYYYFRTVETRQREVNDVLEEFETRAWL